jgi:hypothetical protein
LLGLCFRATDGSALISIAVPLERRAAAVAKHATGALAVLRVALLFGAVRADLAFFDVAYGPVVDPSRAALVVAWPLRRRERRVREAAAEAVATGSACFA